MTLCKNDLPHWPFLEQSLLDSATLIMLSFYLTSMYLILSNFTICVLAHSYSLCIQLPGIGGWNKRSYFIIIIFLGIVGHKAVPRAGRIRKARGVLLPKRWLLFKKRNKRNKQRKTQDWKNIPGCSHSGLSFVPLSTQKWNWQTHSNNS